MIYNKRINPPTDEQIKKMHLKEIQVENTRNYNDKITGIAFYHKNKLYFVNSSPYFNGDCPDFNSTLDQDYREYMNIRQKYRHSWFLLRKGEYGSGSYETITVIETPKGIKTTEITNEIMTE